MSARLNGTWRRLAGFGPALLLGCSSLLGLDELQRVDCVPGECGGISTSAGTANQAGAAAGAGRGGNVSNAGSSSDGGDPGNSAGDGGEHAGSSSGGTGTAGSASTAGSGGSVSGGNNGSGGSAGAPTAGAAGQAGAGGCTPSATDQWCDGLDKACNPTATDPGCIATCQGAFVGGTSYMTCLAASTFDEAEAACVANGMHLVKIDSADENATVLTLAQDDYVWVGGSNRADENVYSWSDGTAFYSSGAPVGNAYVNFAAAEPMQDVNLRCVQLQPTGDWSNWTCSEMQSFVCGR